jgi:mannose-6-phosphate isomerase-like protein (cupin superfamily)
MTLPPVFDTVSLQRDVTGPWRSFDLGEVNGNAARLRVMESMTANWHTHAESDELFYVISGTFHMDTEQGSHEIRSGELFVVPAGTRHRAGSRAAPPCSSSTASTPCERKMRPREQQQRIWETRNDSSS